MHLVPASFGRKRGADFADRLAPGFRKSQCFLNPGAIPDHHKLNSPLLSACNASFLKLVSISNETL